jgi:hypothetical protein
LRSSDFRVHEIIENEEEDKKRDEELLFGTLVMFINMMLFHFSLSERPVAEKKLLVCSKGLNPLGNEKCIWSFMYLNFIVEN